MQSSEQGVCVCVCVCVRERERERERVVCNQRRPNCMLMQIETPHILLAMKMQKNMLKRVYCVHVHKTWSCLLDRGGQGV